MKQLQHVRARIVDPEGATFGRVAPVTFKVTNKGLSLRGFLWKIDQFISLTPIKDKYAESWLRLWRPNTKIEQQTLQVTAKAHAFHKTSRLHWLAITHILFEVIRLLREENQINVADAIWHSVTNLNWRNGSCLESVIDFPEQLTVEKRKGMFRLEETSDGCFEQKWLVDRIMLQGGFWIGRLVRHSSHLDYIDGMSATDGEKNTLSGSDHIGCASQDQRPEENFSSPAQDDAKQNMEMPRATLASQAADCARKSAQQSHLTFVDESLVQATPQPQIKQAKSSDSLSELKNVSKATSRPNYSQYQTAVSMLTKLIDHHMLMESDNQKEVDNPIIKGVSTENLVEFATVINNMDGRNSESFLQKQRAVFDIEGDASGQVLTLTPFQKRLETLPRPVTRSMSVSWVVQPVPNHVDGSEGEGEETLTTVGMVRGMWKLMVQSENEYVLV